MPWKKIDEHPEPKTGDLIWAYLFDVGIRQLEFQSAEDCAKEYGGKASEYDGEWCNPHDHSDTWEPKYWLPLNAIPAPPAK